MTLRSIYSRVGAHCRIAAALITIGILAASCNEPRLVAPVSDVLSLSVCHGTGAGAGLLNIPESAFAEHRGHGDYLAGLRVEKTAVADDSFRFSRIGDAIAAARAVRIARGETTTAACRITIRVGYGVFLGSVQPSSDPSFERLPLTIDVPNVTLSGTFAMPLDPDDRALGADNTDSATTIVASPGLISISTGNTLDKYAEPLIVVNGHPDGPRGNGIVVSGFVLQSGNTAPGAIVGGNAVWAMRAENLVVKGNQIEGGFAEPIEMRASTGRVEQNRLKGAGQSCALCMFGPGNYTVIGNRQVKKSGRLSVLVFPTISAAVPPGVEPLTLPSSALVTVSVTNNDFQDHQEVPFGIGVRVAAIGPGAPNVAGTARVLVQNNILSNNRFGVVAEAGFAVLNTALSGSVELTLANNTIMGSCQTPLLVSMVGQGTAAGLASGPALRNSTFSINLGGSFDWAEAWYSHPAGTGNTLLVDGQAIANGSVVPYDGAKSCSLP